MTSTEAQTKPFMSMIFLFLFVFVFFFFFWCVFLEQEIKSLRSIENDINCEGKRRGVAVYLKGSLKADGIEANHRQGL
jgi:hypothetical protein